VLALVCFAVSPGHAQDDASRVPTGKYSVKQAFTAEDGTVVRLSSA